MIDKSALFLVRILRAISMEDAMRTPLAFSLIITSLAKSLCIAAMTVSMANALLRPFYSPLYQLT
jgi:hypothetical protein